MTAFETKGVELQRDSSSGFQARKRFENSCNICCTRGIRIECDRCAIKVAHETFMGVLEEMRISTKPRVQIGFGF